MTDPTDRYTRIAAGFDARVRKIGAEQWAAPVPSCPDWTVRDLVAHVIGTHQNMLATLGQEHLEPGPDDDLIAAWDAVHTEVLVAVSDHETAERVVKAPFGEQRFADLAGGLLSGDTIYHTWDLARAIGEDDTLDSAACEEVLTDMEPRDAGIRAPGFFGDKITPPADADAQTRLLCFGGRAA